MTGDDPYKSSTLSDPMDFDFSGIDPWPFQDDNGQMYMTGSFDGKAI